MYPSKASDLEISTRERLTKHFLAKVINKLNAFIELSDYQVVAYLLNMPHICLMFQVTALQTSQSWLQTTEHC